MEQSLVLLDLERSNDICGFKTATQLNFAGSTGLCEVLVLLHLYQGCCEQC